MTVSKILEATLVAGSTTVTFTDADIPNSLIRVFSSNPDIIPESRTLLGNTLTVVYPAQSNNMGVAVEIVKQGLDIVDDLTSTDTDKALSAKQGKTLKDIIDDLPAVITNISDMNDVDITDIESGQVLAWDGEKFVNVDQSGGTEIIYSTTERKIGKWVDDTDLYEVTCVLSNITKGYQTVNHGLTGISVIRQVDWSFCNTSASTVVLGHDDTNANWWCDVCYVTSTNVAYKLGTSWTGSFDLVMRIRYSKS